MSGRPLILLAPLVSPDSGPLTNPALGINLVKTSDSGPTDALWGNTKSCLY
jgi:hypothetical protein